MANQKNPTLNEQNQTSTNYITTNQTLKNPKITAERNKTRLYIV